MKKFIKILICSAVISTTYFVTAAQNSNLNNGQFVAYNKIKQNYSRTKESIVGDEQYKYAVQLLSNPYASSEEKKEGLAILNKIASEGNVDAGMFLANAYFKGIGIDKDEEKGIKIIEKLTAMQYPQALYKIGTFYKEGGYIGYTENQRKAFDYFKRAAAKNYSPAFTALGILAEVDLKYSDAYMWYKKAMLQNELYGMTRLANMYKSGKGLEQPDIDEATRIYYLVLQSPEYEHSKFYSAYENIYSIGNKIPKANSETKGNLAMLLIAAGNHFDQIIGEEKLPINWVKNSTEANHDVLTAFYKCKLDVGLKNAVIIKKIASDDSKSKTKQEITYSYVGDIAFYVLPSTSKDVFTKWTHLLQEICPTAKGIIQKEGTNNSYFSMQLKLVDDKFITVELEIVGPKSDRVEFRILE